MNLDLNSGLIPDAQFSQRTRVLVVDDHTSITRLWKDMLERTGEYSVKEENDSRSALQAARSFQPHVLLLDLNMPGLDGSEVAVQIRDDSGLRNMAIVFLTSLVTHRESAAGKRIEGYPCLPKPTCAQSMMRVIECSLNDVAAAAQREQY